MKRSGTSKPTLVGTLRKWKRLSAALLPFARPHRAWLIRGGLAALVVVAARLALPWPLQALLGPWIQPGATSAPAKWAGSWLPAALDPAVAMGGLFLLFMLVLGLADLLERVYFARFAIAATRDLRAAAFRAAMQTHPKSRSSKSGDLVARLVGDSARIKAGLKGFLVHVATNGVMLLGVTGVLLWMDVRLGLIFAMASFLTGTVTLLSARRIYENALKYRKKEGKRADAVQRALACGPDEAAFAGMDDSPGYHKAELTRLQGIATCITHVIFGLAVLASFWVASGSIAGGQLDPRHIVVFTMYALMMRGPIVRLARQGARTGKIFAGSNRLLGPIRSANVARTFRDNSAGPPRQNIQLTDILVQSSKFQDRRPRLGPLSLELIAGGNVALIGAPGSGKTTLLELIAGERQPRTGIVSWDGSNIARVNELELAAHVNFMPQRPQWFRQSIRKLLGLPAGDVDAQTLELLRECGVDSLLERLPRGLDTDLRSDDVSPNECRALSLVRWCRASGSIRLLDDPVAGLPFEIAQRALAVALPLRAGAAGGGQIWPSPRELIVVAMPVPVAIERFDRVIKLDAGRVVFDGDAAGYLASIESSAGDATRSVRCIGLCVSEGGGGRFR